MYNSKYNPYNIYARIFHIFMNINVISGFIENLNAQNVHIKEYKIFSIKFHFSNYLLI